MYQSRTKVAASDWDSLGQGLCMRGAVLKTIVDTSEIVNNACEEEMSPLGSEVFLPLSADRETQSPEL